MLSYLADFEHYFGPLRLLRYLTIRTGGAMLTALVVGFVIGPWLIRRFRELKFGHGYIDERTGALPEDLVLPDDENHRSGGMRWAAGALDGVAEVLRCQWRAVAVLEALAQLERHLGRVVVVLPALGQPGDHLVGEGLGREHVPARAARRDENEFAAHALRPS